VADDLLGESLSQRVRARLKLGRLSDSYKACFCNPETGELTEHGARVLRDLGRFGHLYSSTLKVSPVTRAVDPVATGAAEGRRDVLRRIWAYVRLDPNTHPLMTEKDD
jgi:hypothetical protein